MKDKELDYQERIAHLKSGYDNTQSVVRFLDTKASAVVAGATAVFGLNVALAKWLFSFLPAYLEKVSHWCGFWLLPPLLMIIAIGFISYNLYHALRHAYLTLVPRDTGGSEPSALFPMIPTVGANKKPLSEGEKLNATKQEARIELYGLNCNQADAIKDYTEQLKQMGRIISVKLKHCKLSIEYLFPFIVSSAVLALFSVLVWFSHNNNL